MATITSNLANILNKAMGGIGLIKEIKSIEKGGSFVGILKFVFRSDSSG